MGPKRTQLRTHLAVSVLTLNRLRLHRRSATQTRWQVG